MRTLHILFGIFCVITIMTIGCWITFLTSNMSISIPIIGNIFQFIFFGLICSYKYIDDFFVLFYKFFDSIWKN